MPANSIAGRAVLTQESLDLHAALTGAQFILGAHDAAMVARDDVDAGLMRVRHAARCVREATAALEEILAGGAL